MVRPTSARNSIQSDKMGIKKDFMKNLRRYVQENFEKAGTSVPSNQNRWEDDKLINEMLSDLCIELSGDNFAGEGNKETLAQKIPIIKKLQELIGHPIEKGKSKPGEHKIKKKPNRSSGIDWQNVDAGDGKPAYYFMEPNIIVRNLTNTEYIYVNKRDYHRLGNVHHRKIRNLARISVQIANRNYHEMDPATLWEKEDDIIRKTLIKYEYVTEADRRI